MGASASRAAGGHGHARPGSVGCLRQPQRPVPDVPASVRGPGSPYVSWRGAEMTKRFRSLPVAACLLPALIGGCGSLPVAEPAAVPQAQNIRRVAPQEARRLYGVLTPLLRAMDKPLGPRQVRVGI